MNLSSEVLIFWIWGMFIVSGLLCGWFSLCYCMFLFFVWNVLGFVLFVILVLGMLWSDVIGVYIMFGGILLLLGVIGVFE